MGPNLDFEMVLPYVLKNPARRDWSGLLLAG